MTLAIGHLAVRRATFIRATTHAVWREFETFERFNAWFGTGHELEIFEPHVGGRVELSVDIDGERCGFGGHVLVFDPGSELSFSNNWTGERAWPLPTLVTLRLRALYDGTLVELFHHGFERLGGDAAEQFDAYEAGWDNHHLAALGRIVLAAA